MPSDDTPAAEEQAAHADAGPTGTGGPLPVLATVLAAYHFIGEHLVAFVGVATLVGVVQYLLISQSPLSSGGTDFSPRDVALHWTFILAWVGFSSVVYAVAGVRWCRGLLLGERQPQFLAPIGGREARFAFCIALFIVVLQLLYLLLGGLRFAVTDWAEQRLMLPRDISWTGVVLAARVLATALLFLAFPAIAMDVGRPLGHSIRMACRVFWSLFAVYLLGLIPWTLLDRLSFRVLLLLVDIEKLRIASSMLDAWTMTCTIALAATAYRILAHRDKQMRTAAVFE